MAASQLDVEDFNESDHSSDSLEYGLMLLEALMGLFRVLSKMVPVCCSDEIET